MKKNRTSETDLCPHGGCKNKKRETHSCPYQAEVNNDDEFKCECCPDCSRECAMDV